MEVFWFVGCFFLTIKHKNEWLFGNVVLGVTLMALFPRPADHFIFEQ